LKIFWCKVKEELSLHNARVVNQNSGMPDLLENEIKTSNKRSGTALTSSAISFATA
jgi:hypothetical protein